MARPDLGTTLGSGLCVSWVLTRGIGSCTVLPMDITDMTKADKLKAFKAARRDVARAYAEYDAMARECYRDGYRPAYCVHGTYQWTDYDAMCWQCEDGFTPLEWTMQEYRARCKRYVTALSGYFDLGMVVLSHSNSDAARTLLAEELAKAQRHIA